METLLHVQGRFDSEMTPLILVHAISGLAMPYLALGDLDPERHRDGHAQRPVFGISSPAYAEGTHKLPRSLDDLAREYLALVKRDVRPHGPYLLGGWSMGGMIALRMAALLESQGEEVLHVVLIDSPNPERTPPFSDPLELEFAAQLTYNGVARRFGLPVSEPSTCCGAGDWESSSDEEIDEFLDDDDEDDGLGLKEVLPRMRKHVKNGLRLIGNVKPGQYGSIQSQVTLVKCTCLARFHPSLSEFRKKSIKRYFNDDTMGWRLKNLNTVEFEATHDSVFDPDNAGELTGILAGVLKNVPK